MTVHFKYESDPRATYRKSTTYHYRSASSELSQETIDDAANEFLTKMTQPETWYFQASGIALVRTSDVEHRQYDEVKLEDLPHYDSQRLGVRYCPDDKLINNTPGECVIDGILSFLQASKHYKTITRRKLIAQLGCTNPSITAIERWVKHGSYSYLNYVSIDILDPFRRLMFRHVAKTNPQSTMKMP
jgi:hypothetical protein